MAKNTKGNNVKMVPRCITRMVVVLCGFTTVTLQTIYSWQYACSDSIIQGVSCYNSFRITNFKLFCRSTLIGFAFFGLPILLLAYLVFLYPAITSGAKKMRYSTFFCLLVFVIAFPTTTFTVVPITIFAVGTFVKLRNGLCLLANTTAFCYGLLRHNQFLTNWLCFEPLEGQSLCGSLYYNIKGVIVNS